MIDSISSCRLVSFGVRVTREDNCLPKRIKLLLDKVNRGDSEAIARMIEFSQSCPNLATCDIGPACIRIHAAFLPLAGKP